MSGIHCKQGIAVVGLGNELMTDDGLGVHAIRLLQGEALGDNVQVVEIGTAALHFQDLFERSALVIALDAICAGGPAGQMYCFDGEEADVSSSHSLHDLGAIGVCQLIPREDRPRLILLGAEPHQVDFGTDLSPVLQAVLPHLVEAVKDILKKLKTTNHPIPIDDLFSVRV